MSELIKIHLYDPDRYSPLQLACPNCSYVNRLLTNFSDEERIESFKCGNCKTNLTVILHFSNENFAERPIDQLISMRAKFREQKDWANCDDIRDFLDTQHVFIFDTPEGQVVYNQVKGTRQDIINKINQHKKAEAAFDAWLYSTKKSWEIQNSKIC